MNPIKCFTVNLASAEIRRVCIRRVRKCQIPMSLEAYSKSLQSSFIKYRSRSKNINFKD